MRRNVKRRYRMRSWKIKIAETYLNSALTYAQVAKMFETNATQVWRYVATYKELQQAQRDKTNAMPDDTK